jgi:geranylgeranyl diphosphate synthase type I
MQEFELDSALLLDLASNLDDIEAELRRLFPKSDKNPLTEATNHFLTNRGKLFRPLAVLLASEAVGGSRTAAKKAAVALEVAHISSMIDDDIVDADKARRGVPTVHSVWGVPLAVLAGDYLLIKAFDILASASRELGVPAPRVVWAFERACACGLSMCEGEAFDTITLERRISPEEYISVIERKTGSLVQWALELGAIFGGGNEQEVRMLGTFGRRLGTAFQIVDDVIDVTRKETDSGKPFGSDIKNGRPTLILLHALKMAQGKDLPLLEQIVGNQNASEAQVNDVVSIMRQYSSIDYARDAALRLCEEAKNDLSGLRESDAKHVLIHLADLAVRRQS